MLFPCKGVLHAVHDSHALGMAARDERAQLPILRSHARRHGSDREAKVDFIVQIIHGHITRKR